MSLRMEQALSMHHSTFLVSPSKILVAIISIDELLFAKDEINSVSAVKASKGSSLTKLSKI